MIYSSFVIVVFVIIIIIIIIVIVIIHSLLIMQGQAQEVTEKGLGLYYLFIHCLL